MLDVTFEDKTMCTPVYVKMDAPEQLLLSEGVCRQLGIVTYHPSLGVESGIAPVQTVCIRLVDTVRIPPLQSAVVQLETEGGKELKGPVLLEPSSQFSESASRGVQFGDTLIGDMTGLAQVVLSNPTGFTQSLDKGVWIGHAAQAAFVEPPEEASEPAMVRVIREFSPDVTALRKKELAKLFERQGDNLKWQELYLLLSNYHEAFALTDDERGETGLVQLGIDTGDAPPKKQAPRRAPFALRQEIAKQLRKMQDLGVIRPSLVRGQVQ